MFADAVAQIALQFHAVLAWCAACAAHALQLLRQFFEEFPVARKTVDDCHGFAAAALFVALLYQKRASPADRVSLLIGATVVRFLIALVVLLAVFLLHKGGFLYFFLHFVIQWFLFTVAEIAYLPFPQKKQTK